MVSCAPKISQVRETEQREKRPTITDIMVNEAGTASRITIVGSEVLPYTLYSLEDPQSIIIDLPDVSVAGLPEVRPIRVGPIQSIQARSLSEGKITHIQILLKDRVQYQASREGNLIHLELTPLQSQEVITSQKLNNLPAQTEQQARKQGSGKVQVLGLKYHFGPDQSLIEVETEGISPVYRLVKREKPLRLLLVVEDSILSQEGPPVLRGEDRDKVVDSIKVEEVSQQDRTQVVITMFLKQDVPYLSYQTDNAIKVAVNQSPPVTPVAKEGPRPEPVEKVEKMPKKEAVSTAQGKELVPVPGEKSLETGVAEKKYQGTKISLDFQDADIKSVLRLLSEVSGFNIIAGEDVKGKITTRMINVPWDLALESILKVQALSYEKEANIIRVAPVEKFAQEEADRLRKKQTEEKAEDLQTKVIAINYANVKDLKTNLADLLSARGKITIDERTSTMIIKDLPKNIDQIASLITTLDKQTPQVLIEARIVEVNRNFEKEFGIQWGGNLEQFTKYAFPNTIQFRGGLIPLSGGLAGTPGGGIRDARGVLAPQGTAGSLADPTGGGNFLLNLPAAATLGSGGAIGLTLGHVKNATILDIQLSALENSNHAKVLSSPRVATLDNREAYIQSGQTIAFQTTSAEGTKTEFVDATLSLKVTPHVTPDNFISMKIKATRNEPGARNPQTGAPDIVKREASTEVLVKDGDTTVLGGIINRSTINTVTGIPWISRIPVFGWLFKNEGNQDRNDELLIFITPRIIKTERAKTMVE